MCNQASDLDSIACSAALAQAVQGKPFIPIPRDELSLRSEAVWLLDQCKVDLDKLCFLGEIDLSEASHIILVDHNVPPPQYAAMAPKITQIIDHHKDEYTLAADKTIITTGSCATLVGKHILESGSALSPAMAKLLLGAILIDTRNLAERHPTTPLDRETAEKLIRQAGMTPQESDALYHKLWQLKSDITRFSPQELLKKDYKEVVNNRAKVGFCAIYGPLEAISDNCMEEAEAFRQNRNLDHLVLMTAYYDGDTLKKEMAMLPDCTWNQTATAFLNSKGARLSEKCNMEGITVYDQGNTDLSRKQILPFIKEVL